VADTSSTPTTSPSGREESVTGPDVGGDARVGAIAPTGPPRRRSTGVGVLLVKIFLLGLLDAIAILAVVRLADDGETILVGIVIAATIGLNWIYLTPRAVPLKYLAPGTAFFLMFLVYPVGYTVFLSTTNYGTGNLVSKEQAVTQILDRASVSTAESRRFDLTVLVGPDEELALFLVDDQGEMFVGTADGLTPVDPEDVTLDGDDVERVGEYQALSLADASQRQQEILDIEVPTETGVIQVATFTTASENVKTLVYDEQRDVMVRTVDGTEFRPVEGRFTSADGEQLTPGWRTFIGTDNYQRIVENDAIRGPFIRTFLWTMVFASLSVVLTLALGLALAMTFDHRDMRARRLYRGLLIIPYALPSFMTALIWAGLLNQEFGVVNKMLGVDINWLNDPTMAKISVLLVNLWLGYPYMMLVSMGALQSIPTDVMEAARVDGARPWQIFRLVRFPLLLITLAPLLISSFAFNFNNFNVIYLLTRGGPPVAGSETPAGHTDILISYTYRLAFEGGRGQDYGFATAISVVIFMIVALISAVSFSRTKAYEDLA
jgi:arabinogalactan oligomer / maltooligosaccharide transport system permease protein